MIDSDLQLPSRWPHRWATLMLCTTFPLIWVGGLVTTYDAGMAVPDWPGTYGYNLFLYPWQTWFFGPWDLFIEHGHRLLGATVGMLTIALVVSVYVTRQSFAVRTIAVVALVAVIAQGVLGGMRVLLDERQLALVHGCFGPAFFSLCACIWVMTSRTWRATDSKSDDEADSLIVSRLQRLAGLTVMLAYAQLVIGAHMRHVPVQASPETFRVYVIFHLAGAALLTVHVVLLSRLAYFRSTSFDPMRRASLKRSGALLCGLLSVQIGLGLATWVSKYGWPVGGESYSWIAGHLIEADGMLQSLVVTGHTATGSLILATSMVILTCGWRLGVRKSSANRIETAKASWGATT